MSVVHSFEPVIGTHPKILILGSIPGVQSLQASQYYGNPRNVFWPIMDNLFGIDASQPYAQRIKQLSQLPIILWDIIKVCHRAGSLDSNIQQHTLEANNILVLLQEFLTITLIAFNGAAAEKHFIKLAKPLLPENSNINLIRLPSTSPANASMTFAEKITCWQRLLDYL